MEGLRTLFSKVKYEGTRADEDGALCVDEGKETMR